MAGFANDVVYANNGDFSIAGSSKGSAANGLNTNGQMWIGTTAANVGGTHINVGTLTSPGGTITIGYSSPNITLDTSGSSVIIWNVISASQTLAVRNGYICVAPGGALSLALPAASVLGDIIEVTLDGATSFTITQGAGQQMRLGNQQTTAGVGGSITTNQQGDTIRMVCQIANLKWNILSTMGNLTVV